MFSGGKSTYMIGIKEKITPEVGDKLAVLYQAYRDGTALKSILRTSAGVVAFADDRIVGKWNLLYTPYCFEGEYGNELTWERVKRGAFFGVLAVMIVLLFYGYKK